MRRTGSIPGWKRCHQECISHFGNALFSSSNPAFVTFVFEVVGLHDFGKQYGLRVRFVHYVKLVVGGPFYQVLLAFAAVRAVWREQRGRNDWELTSHVGAHLVNANVNREDVPA